MIGLLTWCEGRVRGMRTLPSSLGNLYPDKYKILCYDNLKLDDLSNFEGFISFPRNTWELPEWLTVKIARQNNIIFFDSNRFSKWNAAQRSFSNGYFYARLHNMPWWWRLFSEKNIEISSSESINIAYYARVEHNQFEKNPLVINLLNCYGVVHRNINFYGFGQEEEFMKIKELFNSKYPKTKIKFSFSTDTDYIFKGLGNGEYWAADLKGDAIPNTYFEAKRLGIKTRIINNENSLTGLKEIDYLLERPNIDAELFSMRDNFSLIIDPKFRSELFNIQKEHNLKFPTPSKESLNNAWDETLNLIKDYNG